MLFAIFPSVHRQDRRAGSIEVSYQGRTNFVPPFAAGQFAGVTGQFAVFILENHSGRRIGFTPNLIEVQTPAGWTTNKTLSPSASPLTPALENWPCFGGVLSTDERLTFLVPFQTTNRPWRIQLDCYEKGSVLRRLREVAFDMWTGSETFSGQHFASSSPAVNP